MRNLITIIAIAVGIAILPINDLSAQQMSEYLITGDIGNFKASKNPSAGEGPGVLARADHFDLDHQDVIYRISYFDLAVRNGAKVQVTQHQGEESDSWLGHEVERDFRNYFGMPGESYVVRTINSNTVLAAGVGGWAYRWLSGNKVVHIEYTDLQMTKPEPLAIIEAYLQKHPSTIAAITSNDLRTVQNRTLWIKDEMSRRLWLCDKWFLSYQEGKVELGETLLRVVEDNLDVFLNYRQEYYDINSTDDKNALIGWMSENNIDAIKNKLEEFKQWWMANKDGPINLP